MLQAGDGAHELNLVAGLVRCAARSNRQGCSPRASDDLGHVLLEKLLAPRGGRVVDEGERSDDIFLMRGEVHAR